MYLSLEFAHIRLSEQELPVEVWQVNGVHVDHINVPEAHHGQVLEEFTAKPAGPNDQHLDVLQEEWQDLCWWSEWRRSERAAPLEHLVAEVKVRITLWFSNMHLKALMQTFEIWLQRPGQSTGEESTSICLWKDTAVSKNTTHNNSQNTFSSSPTI